MPIFCLSIVTLTHDKAGLEQPHTDGTKHESEQAEDVEIWSEWGDEHHGEEDEEGGHKYGTPPDTGKNTQQKQESRFCFIDHSLELPLAVHDFLVS